MLNNGKIRLMTKIALYEEKEEKPKKRVQNSRAIEKRLREVEREIEKLEQKKVERDAAIAESASDLLFCKFLNTEYSNNYHNRIEYIFKAQLCIFQNHNSHKYGNYGNNI